MAIRTYEENGKKLYEVYVNGIDASGVRIQRKRRGIDTLRKAQSIEFELKRELAVSRDEKKAHLWPDWFDVCMTRMKYDCRPSTIINYTLTVGKWAHPQWKNLELGAITKAQVYELVFEQSPGLKTPNAKKNLLKMVKRIFQMAIEEGILDRNPCIGITIKIPELDQKVLTNAEAEIFLKEAKAVNHRFYPIWVMALLTGLRSGEMYALRWTDIDFDARLISITRQWTSKGGFGPTKSRLNRVVPVSEDLLKFLKELKLQRASEDEFVLPHLREWTDGEQARVTRDFCAAVGVTPVKFHDLRATFITNLLARGESLARVMSVVGHNELKTTNGYLRRAGVEVVGATEKLGYKLPVENAGAKVLSIIKGSES
ncbi:MAG: site-specific integrase [Oligoflexia bacterium]|nr:site-specific integrase [Oligoflexia bacterium]